MPAPVLIDTSAWIEALRSEGNEAVRREVRLAIEEGVAVFCDMVRLELWNGARGQRELKYLASLENELGILPTTDGVWEHARKLARQARRSGVTVPATDLLIAACAAAHGASLLHQDSHFDQIRDI